MFYFPLLLKIKIMFKENINLSPTTSSISFEYQTEAIPFSGPPNAFYLVGV